MLISDINLDGKAAAADTVDIDSYRDEVALDDAEDLEADQALPHDKESEEEKQELQSGFQKVIFNGPGTSYVNAKTRVNWLSAASFPNLREWFVEASILNISIKLFVTVG